MNNLAWRLWGRRAARQEVVALAVALCVGVGIGLLICALA